MNKDKIFLSLILILYVFFFILGIQWGIPDNSRAKHYYEDPGLEARENPNSIALHSYHPDEPKIIMAISNMNPSKLDFNPKFFIYPSLYIYLVAIALKVSSLLGFLILTHSKEFYFANVDQIGSIYLVGRLITAMFGIGTVYLAYIIGGKLYTDKNVAILAAFFLAITPAFVVHSHFMTVDVSATFWILLAIFFSSKIYEHNNYKWYILAGLATGLATSTKYYAVLVILSVASAHYISKSDKGGHLNFLRALFNKRMLASYSFALLGFIITSPYTILAPKDFYNEGILVWFDTIFLGGSITKEIRLFALDRGIGWLDYLVNVLPTGMGWPFYLLCLCGVIYAIVNREKSDFLMFSWLLPYFLIIGVFSSRHVRYSIPLLPIFSIFAARLVFRISRKLKPGVLRYGWAVVVAFVVLFTSAYSLSHVKVMMGKDNRDFAAEWIKDHVKPGSIIGVGWSPSFYSVPLDPHKFQIEVLCPIQTGLDKETFNQLSPQYLVFSEFEYRQYLRLKDRFPKESNFFSKALNGRLTTEDFNYQVRWFDRSPNLLGIDFNWRFPPHDWIYTHPAIIVLERRPLS